MRVRGPPAWIRLRSLDAREVDSIVLDVVKRSEDGQSLVVRFHETEGNAGSVAVSAADGKPQRLRVCDLHERPVGEIPAGRRVPYRAYEIVTLRLDE